MRVSKAYDIGFAQGYRDDRENIRCLENPTAEDITQYRAGRKAGKQHFDRVLELMEVLHFSLREVHELAVDRLYHEIKEQLLND